MSTRSALSRVKYMRRTTLHGSVCRSLWHRDELELEVRVDHEGCSKTNASQDGWGNERRKLMRSPLYGNEAKKSTGKGSRGKLNHLDGMLTTNVELLPLNESSITMSFSGPTFSNTIDPHLPAH